MAKQLHHNLEVLERSLLAQASMVEQMVQLATRCLCNQTTAGIDDLREIEQRVNAREVQIENECLEVLALGNPVATDLRRVTTVMKINTDLERMGDLAVSIGEHAQAMTELAVTPMPWQLEQMVNKAMAMVRDALNAFVDSNAQQARQVLQRDDDVDSLFVEIIGEIEQAMREDIGRIQSAMHLFSATRAIERIADLATNIAEDAIYLVEGEIARHQGPDASPRASTFSTLHEPPHSRP